MLTRGWIVFTVGALAVTAQAQGVRFQDISDTSGLIYSGIGPMGTGVGIGDYDGDGWDDVVLVGATADSVQLYHNNGDKTFTNVRDSVLPDALPRSSSAHLVDLDNDGDKDLVLSRWFGTFLDSGFHYLVNEGGVFVAGVNSDGMARSGYRTGGTAVADLDYDGDLDVVLMHFFGTGNYVRNEGIFNLVDGSTGIGANLTAERPHWSVVLADFNNDGFTDIHAAIDLEVDYQARNLGDGTFVDVSAQVGVTNDGADMGLAVGDIENDGDLDIYSSTIGSHNLYVNDGVGNFTMEAGERGVERGEGRIIGFGWGCEFHDWDHDGDLDLAMVTQSGHGSLYMNDGTGHFTFGTRGSRLRLTGLGLISFDMDHDGDLDIIVTPTEGPPLLYENITDFQGRSWLIVDTKGVTSNRDGIGTRVYVTVGPTTMMRESQSGGSFHCTGPLYAHFGLGEHAIADQVRIRWPSGLTRTMTNVAANRYLTVFEPLVRDGNLIGDFDLDCDVDLDDLSAVLTQFGSTLNPSTGDSDLDGDVDLQDLALLLSQFGAGCP